jgi:putative Mg2+ transporter-C (MgtC) family protein
MLHLDPETLQFVSRMLVALLFGCMIGLERQWRHGMAGTRTHGLVSLGGAAFVIGGQLIPGDVTAAARVASYVVSGVGFLCAGAIFRDGATVKGVNTAATIWCAAAVGLLTGFGCYTLGMVLSVMVMVTSTVLRPLAYRWQPGAKGPVEIFYEIRTNCSELNEEHVRSLLLTSISQAQVRLLAIHSQDLLGTGEVELTVEIMSEGEQLHEVERIATLLSMEPGTRGVSWKLTPKENP